jgi:N-acylneuraminate cytidylyltransferase/CMP-N,N'-diacetyllegionaminic acid synthase
MINGFSVLGLILARGGSKGLPGKNIMPLRGKPLIGWTAAAARPSKYLDALAISTDSEEIAAVARGCGIETPFMRPAALAVDTATSIDAIIHALDWFRDAGRNYDTLVLLEPTSPLRETSDIDGALEKLMAPGCRAVVSVCRAESVHPAFMYRLGEHGFLQPYAADQPGAARRQDIEALYFLEGTVYASRIDALRELRSFYHQWTIGIEVPKWKSPEIDDIVDFLHVEAIMKHRNIGA